MSIFIRSGHNDRPIRLDACPGFREVEGAPRPCPAGCKAHFDAWTDPRRHFQQTSLPYSPFPNSLLSWLGQLPGSTCLVSWSARDHACAHDPETSIREYRNDALFCTQNGTPMPGWVVILDEETDCGHFAALFDNADDARSFSRDHIDSCESDCICSP